MKKLLKSRAFLKLKTAYNRITSKKYSTLAGTLVFFMLLSLIPFVFITTSMLSAFNVKFDWFFNLEIFNNYTRAITLLLETAKGASKGASLFFLLSAVYSSTNFFYHMRRSGEIIYNYNRKKPGLIIRASAAVLVVLVMFGTTLAGSVFFGFQQVFGSILPSPVLRILIYTGLSLLCFIVLIILNLYICPYRNRIRNTLKGSLFTLLFWLIVSVLFSFYTNKIANMQRLYGAVTFFMVFLLWLYLMMQGLIIGVILNMKETLINEEKKY